MAVTIPAIIALAILMAMVGLSAWNKTMTSRPVLLLLPAITISVAVSSMLVEAKSPLFPVLVISMCVAAVTLMLTSITLMVIEFIRSHRPDPKSDDEPCSVETE